MLFFFSEFWAYFHFYTRKPRQSDTTCSCVNALNGLPPISTEYQARIKELRIRVNALNGLTSISTVNLM